MLFALRAESDGLLRSLYEAEPLRVDEILQFLFPYSMQETCLYGLLCLVIALTAGRNKTLPALTRVEGCGCALFSLCLTAGASLLSVDGFFTRFHSVRMLAAYLFCLIGNGILLWICLVWMKLGLQRLMTQSHMPAVGFGTEGQLFLRNMGILALCWLPYAALRYPAGLEYDGYHQIARFLEGRLTTHWPPASSAWMGSFVRLGETLLHSANAGIFLYVLVNLLLGAAVFAYSLTVLTRFGVPRICIRCLLVLYALIPVYPGFITSVVKDAPFAVLVLWFTLLLSEQVIPGSQGSLRGLLLLCIAGFLMAILRNNGIFLILGAMAGLPFLRGRARRGLLTALGSAAMLFGLYQYLFLPMLHIPAGSVAEALSVPFQQTARLIREAPEAVTPEEQSVIAEVLDWKTLKKEYDPFLADPVKSSYHTEDRAALFRYLRVWFREGLRCPGIYLDAFLINGIGFFYPGIRMDTVDTMSGVYTMIWNDKEVQFTVPSALEGVRPVLKRVVRTVENLPLVLPFVNTAIQCWMPVCLMLWAIRRRDREAAYLLIPSVLGVLVCLASPTYMNNGARYALPMVYTNLFLIATALRRKGTEG
ncbi:MAG: hypothetical protein IJT34_08985 [Butyrivibrio sp.]|nr:hypothetical protein [Butyrivibrio sp.]